MGDIWTNIICHYGSNWLQISCQTNDIFRKIWHSRQAKNDLNYITKEPSLSLRKNIGKTTSARVSSFKAVYQKCLLQWRDFQQFYLQIWFSTKSRHSQYDYSISIAVVFFNNMVYTKAYCTFLCFLKWLTLQPCRAWISSKKNPQ